MQCDSRLFHFIAGREISPFTQGACLCHRESCTPAAETARGASGWNTPCACWTCLIFEAAKGLGWKPKTSFGELVVLMVERRHGGTDWQPVAFRSEGRSAGHLSASRASLVRREPRFRRRHLRVTAKGNAERGATERHNADREIGVPGGRRPSAPKLRLAGMPHSERRSRSLIHPLFARMGSG